MKNEEREILELVKKAPAGSVETLTSSARMLQELSRFMLKDTVQAFTSGMSQELLEIRRENRRLQRTLVSLPKTERESFYYEAGVFIGAYGTVVELQEASAVQEEWKCQLNLLNKKHVKDILLFLYQNPYSRQKHIAENVNIRPNYLSEILHLLLDAELVERTGKNKSTQYYLLRAGRNIVRTRVLQFEAEKPVIDVDYRELEEKDRFLENEGKEKAKLAEKGEELYGAAKWKLDIRFDYKTAGYR